MTTYGHGVVNDLYPLVMPDFRVRFHAERPNWEKGRLQSCHDLMGDGMVVYDIGAEHGDFTALYASWGCTVIPIEPAAHYWPFIRGTFEANNLGVPPYCFEGLVGDEEVRDRGGQACAGVWPDSAFGAGVADGGFLHLAHDVTMRRTTVDKIAEVTPPDALVIDIEGAEWHALAGAKETLRDRKPLVWVSVHEPTMLEWYDRTLGDIFALMDSVGYSGLELPHHGEGETFWLFRHAWTP